MENTTAAFTSGTSGSEEITNLVSQLPSQVWFDAFHISQWHGYWYSPAALEGMFTAQSHFKARHDDIIITSAPKTGTTWLKSLVSTIMNATQDDDADPLIKNNPHAVVETLEVQTYVKGRTPDLSSTPSPRIFHTHLPYNSIPDSIKESNCKVIYVARNPKDVFVSMWHFANSVRTPEQGPYPIGKALESFCNGVGLYAPYLDHVLEYWNESLVSPKKIMFFKYEELKRNPMEEVKKLASFLGRPLVTDEEVANVARRCSFERLKSLEINKTGRLELGMPHRFFFRKGAVGDWKNVFTAEMQERVDQLVRTKYEGSGLNLDV